MILNYQTSLELLMKHPLPRKKLCNRTYLEAKTSLRDVWNKKSCELPEYFEVKLFDKTLFSMWKDGIYKFGDVSEIASRSSQDRFRQFTPFRPWTRHSVTYLTTPSGTRPLLQGVSMDARGDFTGNELLYLNNFDANRYMTHAQSFLKELVHQTLRGKMRWVDPVEALRNVDPAPDERWLREDIVRRIRGHMYEFETVHALLKLNTSSALRGVSFLKLLRSCGDDLYKLIWLKPTSKKMELEKYGLELAGGLNGLNTTNRPYQYGADLYGKFYRSALKSLRINIWE